jgi:ribosomal protein S18 acetylase RimI-like enzyme
MGLEFRKLDFNEFKDLVKWAALEGWDPGVNDAEIFYTCFPNAFYGCFQQGKLIGGGSLVSYHGDFGFMGFFIVDPEYRGKGIGRSLWNKRRDTLLELLNPGAPIGMDGVLAMQDFYTHGGFTSAFRDERRVRLGAIFPIHPSIRKFSEATKITEILKFDMQCFGVNREEFMKLWIANPSALTFYTVNEKEEVIGYAVLRKTYNGWKIGPLFANEFSLAEALYTACLNEVPNEMVYLDIPCCNPYALKLAEMYQTEYVFECARMYHGTPLDLPMDKVFGITTFELG